MMEYSHDAKTSSSSPEEPASSPLHQNLHEPQSPWRTTVESKVLLWTNSSSSFHIYDLNHDPLHHISFLTAALMLACSLACIAGVDAKIHCHSQQIYAIQELFDDDGVIYTQLQRIQQEDACVSMFRLVMIPITVITLVGGILSQCLMRRNQQQEKSATTTQGQYRLFVQLWCISASVLISWTYGIFSIMLRPKNLSSQEQNQFQSLAAVDQMGHVGDNANLYYLSWICMGTSLAIFYQLSIEMFRQYRQTRNNNKSFTSDGVEVTATTCTYREYRESWYHSLYRLRIRSGIWVAALLGTFVVMLSSLLLWRDVLRPAAREVTGQDIRFLGVCAAIHNNNDSNTSLPPELCVRTAFSILSGGIATILCITAIIIHMSTRHSASTTQSDSMVSLGGPLRVEFILSILLSTLLGLNAVLATAVQGPAATVGNLYYNSWCSFLLCLRILLGCLEEVHNLGKEEHDGGISSNKSISTDAASTTIMSPDLFDNERAQKARRYLFLGIVSTICSASALDACFNQSEDLSWDQWYVIVAPAVIAVLCAIQFYMCLGPVSYVIISSNLIGGSLAIFMFLVWLVDLIITMHSERSWAVNAIGNVTKIANLYYFSWASIVTAGLHMSTFLFKILRVQQEDYMTVIWGVMVKVNVVILGAAFHIWHNISDSCSLQDIQASAIDFCSRTVFALMVSLVGMAVGGVVVLTRVSISLLCNAAFPFRIRSHVEMIIASFLVLVFGVALALITGIGGPGQSVGDLYYATWLAFLVSLLIGITCYNEIRRDELETSGSGAWKGAGVSNSNEQRESETSFVQMT